MISWFSTNKKPAVQSGRNSAVEKAERDARLRAELAIKARQFDEEYNKVVEEKTEDTSVELTSTGEQKKRAHDSITIGDVSARTFFNS